MVVMRMGGQNQWVVAKEGESSQDTGDERMSDKKGVVIPGYTDAK